MGPNTRYTKRQIVGSLKLWGPVVLIVYPSAKPLFGPFHLRRHNVTHHTSSQ